ncbi:MAG: SHOCT domain-containing protein [Eubacteriales bacterium]
MSPENLQNELMYQSTMALARKMLTNALITREEYGVIDTTFLKKYNPILGSLCTKTT